MNLSNHVILYLDILGYSDIVGNSKQKEKTYLNIIFSLMKEMKLFIDNWGKCVNSENNKMYDFKSCMFSDNILFFAPYDSSIEQLNIAMNFLYGISQFLFQYNKGEFFFRGSLTAGPLFYDEDLHFVFGSGLVNAAKIEKQAIFPMIKIDTDTIDYLKSSKKMQSILTGIGINQKDGVYVDYLRFGYASIFDNSDKDRISQILFNEKRAIERAILAYRNNPYILEKYEWLATYHNVFCKEKLITNCSVDIVLKK